MTTQPEMPFPAPQRRRRATNSPRATQSPQDDYFECPRCGKRFDTLPEFDQHRKEHR